MVPGETYKLAYAPIEDSDQPAHPRSLSECSIDALWVAKGSTLFQDEN